MRSFIEKNINRIEIDAAIAYTILSRVIQAGGGLISIFFISKYLTGNDQGYYYTFGSILAIQVFFELGLSGIITQYASYEFAHLKRESKFELTGEEIYKSRLSSLLRFCIKWFGIISIILFIILLIAGFYFFSKYNSNLDVEWKKPWIILCLATSMNLFIDPLLAFFDGLSEVKDMARVRLIQKSCNVILLFVFFELGFKLYSSALAALAAITINYIQILFSNRIELLKSIWSYKSNWVINYYLEIFPFQWRIALSWISGYFIFQLFNPVLFATEGAVVAGQMGMTIAALGGLASISMSWITTKIPLLSTLIAKKDYKSLDSSFKTIFISSVGINILGNLSLILIIQIARLYNLPIGSRFLPVIPFVCMGLASLINQAIFAFATYLRCHKKEPMLLQSIVMGVLVSVSTLYLGNIFGLYGISIGYFLLSLSVGLIWTIYIFITKRREWHYA